jgi:hypothetical protein
MFNVFVFSSIILFYYSTSCLGLGYRMSQSSHGIFKSTAIILTNKALILLLELIGG